MKSRRGTFKHLMANVNYSIINKYLKISGQQSSVMWLSHLRRPHFYAVSCPRYCRLYFRRSCRGFPFTSVNVHMYVCYITRVFFRRASTNGSGIIGCTINLPIPTRIRITRAADSSSRTSAGSWSANIRASQLRVPRSFAMISCKILS